jgi:hypothetical protein
LTYFQAIKGEDQNFLTIKERQSKTLGRFWMAERSILPICEQTKTGIRGSLPRKKALDWGEWPFLAIKRLNFSELQSMANTNTEITRRKFKEKHKHMNQILGFILKEKSNRDIREERKFNPLL